eukprot:3194336-Rhodomonas_salina.2
MSGYDGTRRFPSTRPPVFTRQGAGHGGKLLLAAYARAMRSPDCMNRVGGVGIQYVCFGNHEAIMCMLPRYVRRYTVQYAVLTWRMVLRDVPRQMLCDVGY